MPSRDALFERWSVSRETVARLEIFENLLKKWNPRINLVSRNSLQHVRQRHIVDSIQVFRCVAAADDWVDLGSGGGFPGLVVAILAAEEAPAARVTLIESDQRKAVFLRSVLQETGVAGLVLSQRIEQAPAQNANIVSARALADLSRLLEFADRHLKPDGTALFSKGVTWKNELEAAREQWRFDAEVINSVTEPAAVILKISGVSRV